MNKQTVKKTTAPVATSSLSAPTAPAATTVALKKGGKTPTTEEIAQRAYEIFLKNGSVPGRDMENWLQAEKELKG